MTPPPSDCPALVLNADFRPLSYFPLSLLPWQEAIKAVFQDRVNVVCEYDRVVRSPSMEIRLPSVISLKEYVSSSRKPAFTRFNLFLRDDFTCQYCGSRPGSHSLTFDHVLPRVKGGRTSWENIVTACSPCNSRKGSKTLREVGMHLRHSPERPSAWQLQENGRRFPPNYLHESWRDFLYWDSELDHED
ncbi:HNH endonuclease [Radicibacter daui]|uniref:HNH endonuclease n=1 Tax=Radicibacter daui TaxID=3064829 RepID=UPI004046F87D